jgi:hypothetical protein
VTGTPNRHMQAARGRRVKTKPFSSSTTRLCDLAEAGRSPRDTLMRQRAVRAGRASSSTARPPALIVNPDTSGSLSPHCSVLRRANRSTRGAATAMVRMPCSARPHCRKRTTAAQGPGSHGKRVQPDRTPQTQVRRPGGGVRRSCRVGSRSGRVEARVVTGCCAAALSTRATRQ